MALRQMMRLHHMEDKRDYSLIPGIALNQFPMLEEHKADLVVMSNPQRNDPRVKEAARTLFTARDAEGTIQWALYAARAGFLAKNHAAFADFVEDLVRVTHWQLDPAHRDEMIKILAGFTKQPPEFYESYLYTTDDNYRDPDCRPDLTALASNLQVMKGLGFLKSDIDVASHTDLSFVDQAVRRLK
jgi:NitT/TauT family transport system substrate-binding protein